MWPMRLDMSRDECQKCLRCLELNAYGTMVSVLRAQGAFTGDKQKLLQDLAKILRISADRHRAEIRRAVNDEELSTIAEQLNGPNTSMDWAIEGRRTVPLLPRLAARSVFTGLAGSLSLVTRAANEKESTAPVEGQDNVKVKVEPDSRVEFHAEEHDFAVENIPVQSDGEASSSRKRRKSFLEPNDIGVIQLNEGTEIPGEAHTQIPADKSTSLSMMSAPSCRKVLIVSSSSVLDVPRNIVTERITKLSTASSPHSTTTITCQSLPATHLATGSVGSDSIGSCKTMTCRSFSSAVVPSFITAGGKSKSKVMAMHAKAHSKAAPLTTLTGSVQHSAVTTVQPEIHNAPTAKEMSTKFVSLSSGMQKASKFDHFTSLPCMRRITTTAESGVGPPMVTKTVPSGSRAQGTTVIGGSTVSSGPGPPEMKPTATGVSACKKITALKPGHQPATTKSTTLNAGKTSNITSNSGTRVAAKANVIVVQKGCARGITLSHAGKEVLGKVIVGGRNICLSNQQSAGTIALLPHRIAGTGEQDLAMLSPMGDSHTESVKTNAKSGNMILFDLRQEDFGKNKVLSQFLEASGVFSSESKDRNSLLLVKEHRDEAPHSKSVNSTSSNPKGSVPVTFLTDEKAHRTEIPRMCQNFDRKDIIAAVNSTIEEIPRVSESSKAEHGTLDPQTGVYSFHPTDDSLDSIQLEEPMPDTGIDIFSTALASADINLESFRYMDDDDNNDVLEEARNPILAIDQLNDIYDCQETINDQ